MTTNKSYKFVHEDKVGNKYYPHTMADIVHVDENTTIGDWVTGKDAELSTAINNATTQANYAKTQGDYAKTQGDSVNGRVTALETNKVDKTVYTTEQATQDKRIKTIEDAIKNGDIGSGGSGGSTCTGSNVTLGGESQSNFNFIADKVVQDGLVYENINEFHIESGKYIVSNLLYEHDKVFDIIFKAKLPIAQTNQGSNRGLVGVLSSYNNYGWFVNVVQNNYETYNVIKNTPSQVKFTSTQRVILDKYVQYRIVLVNGLLTLFVDGEVILKDVDMRDTVLQTQSAIVFGYSGQGLLVENGYYRDILVYNRQLSPQEIAHNFNVLNNSPSISALEVTNEDNQTSILSFSTDSEHVTMDTGYTLEDSYTELLKVNAKDFVADSNGEIKVDNAIAKQKVIGATIEGQTVKNVWQYETHGVDGTRIFFNNKQRSSNKGYYFYNNTTKTIMLSMYQEGTNAWAKNYEVPSNNFKLLNDDGLYVKTIIGHFQFGWTSSDVDVLKNTCNIIDKQIKLSSGIPFGLSSTEASITNNGIKHTFYASEEDKANQKPILLGGVDGVSDKLVLNDDGSLSGENKTKEIIVTGDEDWKAYASGNDVIVYKLQIQLNNYNVICNRLPSVYSALADQTKNYVSGSLTQGLMIGLLKTLAQNTDEFKLYLKQQYLNGNAFTIRYIPQPTTYTVDKSVNEPIPTNKSNILSTGDAVKASKFTANIPIDKFADMQMRLALMENVLNTKSNLDIFANYVTDEYNSSINTIQEVMK